MGSTFRIIQFFVSMALAVAADASAQSAARASDPVCQPRAGAGSDAGASVRRDSLASLAGIWDFRMYIDNVVSTGFVALGWMDNGFGGSLTPYATNTVAIRKLTVHLDSVHMVVASPEGDVLFDGHLTRDNGAMCGVVTYHGGRFFPMVVTRRLTPRSASPASSR